MHILMHKKHFIPLLFTLLTLGAGVLTYTPAYAQGVATQGTKTQNMGAQNTAAMVEVNTAKAAEQTNPANTDEKNIGRLIPIFDVTLNAKPDFPPCARMLPMRSAEGGSCITIDAPKTIQSLPFFDYITSLGQVWYSVYDREHPIPRLVKNSIPLLGLDEEGHVVYLMTYPKVDETSQEAVFAMLKTLFGEPDVLEVKPDDSHFPPEASQIDFDEWFRAAKETRIALWSNDEVWVRYVFDDDRGNGILVVGLKRILNGNRIPNTYSY